jgi:hypothetical protein
MSEDDIHRFVAGEIEPARFSHAEHVRLAYEMLTRHGFLGTLSPYAGGLRLITARAGRPQAYHETLTTAFLALIAERLLSGDYRDFKNFAAANPDLFEKSCLSRFYSAQRLQHPLARRTFLLPDGGAITSPQPDAR